MTLKAAIIPELKGWRFDVVLESKKLLQYLTNPINHPQFHGTMRCRQLSVLLDFLVPIHESNSLRHLTRILLFIQDFEVNFLFFVILAVFDF